MKRKIKNLKNILFLHTLVHLQCIQQVKVHGLMIKITSIQMYVLRNIFGNLKSLPVR